MTTPIAQGPVDVNVMPLAARIQWLESLRSAAAIKADDFKAQAIRCEKDAAMAAQLLTEARRGACGGCRGFGRVRIQYAQDDIKSERCDRCGGTGGA